MYHMSIDADEGPPVPLGCHAQGQRGDDIPENQCGINLISGLSALELTDSSAHRPGLSARLKTAH